MWFEYVFISLVCFGKYTLKKNTEKSFLIPYPFWFCISQLCMMYYIMHTLNVNSQFEHIIIAILLQWAL